MKNHKRLIANIVEIAIGIILSVLGYMGMIDEYWTGMGTALIVVGIIFMIRLIRYQTNAEYKDTVDVEVNDERNRYLRLKAWAWAGYMLVLICAFASIIFKLLGNDQLSVMSGGCVCLLIVLYWGSYLILRKKY
ncbi:MAG: hypothetical protein IIW56_00900 [Oscillospiraceae bacterium]|nr:hypothetical protein [Oscillospiraceae bacterium]